MSKKNRIPHKYLPWIAVRKKFRLSHAHTQMARELGMNPKKFDNMANCEGKPWKLPLPQYIESLYEEKFGKREPDVVKTIEQMAAERMAIREAKKAQRNDHTAAANEPVESTRLDPE